MTKYKSGDTINYEGVLDKDAADFLNRGGAFSGFTSGQVIRHSPAPEPIVRFANIYNSGSIYDRHLTLEDAKKSARDNCLGQIKITITGDDFTVEKVK